MTIQAIAFRATCYFLEGAAVGAVAYFIPRRKLNLRELIIVMITAALVFAILDFAAPVVGNWVMAGAGLSLGIGLIESAAVAL